MKITIFPLRDFPIINPGDPLVKIIVEELRKVELMDGDIIVIAHTIVSKSENKVYNLNLISPSPFAHQIGSMQDKDPRKIEVILRESSEIIRMNNEVLITATHHGFICANSGIDKSNTPGDTVISLPEDPDLSARQIKESIQEKLQKNVAVIISDTFGRPLRVGTVNFAIGLAGIAPLEDIRGKTDLFGYELRSTIIARADEVAAAAGIVMGQADEGTPVIIVKGVEYTADNISARDLIRDPASDVFR
ncbi:MAG: coenzyme F420-0:L-glutamate ligase [Candidatus Hodarchaeales archaeon]|jgi:coenzyme F420-0:L-glutamate ligase/coenzyme F420-1:gamma-L-glutamate ligase